MPDISMCMGKDHELCNTCYRKNAEASPYMQSYFVDPPIKDDSTCEMYWKDYEDKEESGGE
jgi:hypothetical protein